MADNVVYGVRAVAEALASGRHVNRVYLAKESRAAGAAAVAEQARGAGVRCDYVPQAKLNTLTGTREHQGVAAAVSPVDYVTLEALLADCRGPATLLALDQVQHPKNLGMLIRTATGAGVSGVVLPKRGGALLDDTIVRASAGTVMHLPVAVAGNLAQALRKVKEAGFWVFALDGGGKTDVFRVNWPERCVVVMGNETHGVRPGVLKVCDDTIAIPLAHGLDSLNVSVAAGVALFQAYASRRTAVSETGKGAGREPARGGFS